MSFSKPFFFELMLCESAERPPEGPRMALRAEAGRLPRGRKSGRSAQLWSRNQKDFTRRFPAVVKGIAELPSDTVIDGEIVALDEHGKPSFNLLQGFGGEASSIVLYAFDLLMWQGKDVRLWPLEERCGQLREVVQQRPDTIRWLQRRCDIGFSSQQWVCLQLLTCTFQQGQSRAYRCAGDPPRIHKKRRIDEIDGRLISRKRLHVILVDRTITIKDLVGVTSGWWACPHAAQDS
jgi:hypothetical protein